MQAHCIPRSRIKELGCRIAGRTRSLGGEVRVRTETIRQAAKPILIGVGVFVTFVALVAFIAKRR